MRRRSNRGQPYSLAAAVSQMWVTMPGPDRSASTMVSPGMGRLESSLLSGSGLLLEERNARYSFSSANDKGSSSWAQAAGASNAGSTMESHFGFISGLV